MVSIFTFFVLLSIGLVYSTPVGRQSCEAKVSDPPGSCRSRIYLSKPCASATLNLGVTSLKSCTEVNLSWDYPTNNLTMIIETPFTQQHQSYAVNLDNYWLFGIQTYRILNGKEIEVKSNDNVVVENSDSNYQVILKLQAPPTLSLYVLFFNYNVTKV
ncbi:unnamed protein product [Didymodactylos carnosus]|uniref:Uncharacterized protein n=1 Tax=Didymodactylos carnosus TaxID=1234261 RepID=A0A8S2FDK4_9BILA|nr:unnamed protein product [Didymodactylos carnosus]CAF4232478.1 unnamed protein product [Didymodactylos carnosus]